MSDGALNAEILEPQPPRLTAAEAEELLRYVSELARTGVDLPRGLRQAAEGASSPRLAEALRRVATQVEVGRSPEAVLADADWSLPPHLAGMLAAAMQSGNCGVVLGELGDVRGTVDDLWRESRRAISYPLIMFTLSLATMLLLLNLVVPPLQRLYDDFELPLPIATQSLLWVYQSGQWLILGWLSTLVVLAMAVRWFGSWSLVCRARIAIPLVGRLLLWSAVIESLRMVKLLTEQGLPLPQAWRLAADGQRDGHVAAAARRIGRACEQGQTLSQALDSEHFTFPATLVPLVSFGERAGRLPEVLEVASAGLLQNLRARTEMLRTATSPLVFLLVATMVVSMPLALFLPLITLIQGLSGGGVRTGGAGGGVGGAEILFAPGNLLLFLPLAVSLTFSRRMLYGDHRTGVPSWLEALLWRVEIGAWLAAIIGYFLMAQSFVSGIFLLAGAYVLLSACFRYWSWQRRGLLLQMALAAEYFVSFAEMARARYEERSDRLGRKSLRLARMLEQGFPLPQALQAVGIRLALEEKVALEAAFASENIGKSLRRSLERITSLEEARRSASAGLAYLAWISVVMLGVVSYVMLKIVPVWAKMFYEYDLPMPSMTETLIKYSTIAANYGFLLVPAVLLGGPLVLVACNTWAFSLASWLIPPLELFRLRRHGVWLMHALATLVRNGRPLTPSLAVLAERYPRAIIGRRIARAVQQTEAGIPWTAALRHQGLISSYDAALLAAAERNNHLAWALEEAAEGVERRREIRMKYLSNVLLPVVLLLLGTTVAMIVIALFVPLIALIQGLAGSR